MTERQYIIVYNPLDPRFNPVDIKRVIKSDDSVTHWWNHIPNCFLLTTTKSEKVLARTLRERAPGVGFLITEIDLRHSDGSLPRMSWEWIMKREKESREAEAA